MGLACESGAMPQPKVRLSDIYLVGEFGREVALIHRSIAKPHLLLHSTMPLNGEPPLAASRATLITAVKDFYIRSHGNIPRIKEKGFLFEVRCAAAKALVLTMKDLRANFRHRKVTATLQCAGNRRRDMLQVRSVSGDPWAPGAIGNAEWGGASLRDVLKAAGDLELVVRAWDSAGQTQPALPDETWNFKGYLSTAWHRVKVIVS